MSQKKPSKKPYGVGAMTEVTKQMAGKLNSIGSGKTGPDGRPVPNFPDGV